MLVQGHQQTVARTRRDAVPTLYPRQRDGRAAAAHLDLRAVAFFTSALVLIALAGSLYLQQASQVAGYAHEIRELEAHKEQLRREITALRADVATLGAMGRIMKVGERRGYLLPSPSDTTRRSVISIAPAVTPPAVPAASAAQPAESLLLDEPDGLVNKLLGELSAWLAGEPAALQDQASPR